MYNTNGLATTGGRLIQSALSIVMGLAVIFFFIEVKNIPDLLDTKKSDIDTMSNNANGKIRSTLSSIAN